MKEEALQTILTVMDKHSLTIKDISKAHSSRKNAAKGKLSRSAVIMRLFTYIGGAFIFAGLASFIGLIWDDLGSLSRVILTLGTGFTAYILGLLFAKNDRLEKAATPAHLLAFLLQPTGMFVFLHEYVGGDNIHLGAMLVFGILATQQCFTFIGLKRTSLLLFTAIYTLGFIGATIEYLEFHRAFSSLVIGTGFLFLTADLQKREHYKELTSLFYLISTSIFFSGLYFYTGNTIYDPVNLAVILGMLTLATLKDSKTLYVLAILFLISYMGGGPGGGWGSWHWQNELSMIITGASLVLSGVWLRQVNHNAAIPFWMFFGSGFFMGGSFALIEGTAFEIAYIAIAAASVYAALLLRSKTALGIAIISLIGYIGYFTEEHFKDVIGWPLLMILLGFLMLGAGVFFVRISRTIERKI